MNMRPREFCDKFKKGFCPTRNSLVPESIPIVTPPIYPYPLLCSFRDNLTSPLLSLLPSPLSLLSHSHSPFSHSHSPHSPSAIPTRALLPLPHITLHHRIIPLTEPAQEFSSVYFTDHSLSAPLSHIHTAHLFCFPSSFFFFLFLLPALYITLLVAVFSAHISLSLSLSLSVSSPPPPPPPHPPSRPSHRPHPSPSTSQLYISVTHHASTRLYHNHRTHHHLTAFQAPRDQCSLYAPGASSLSQKKQQQPGIKTQITTPCSSRIDPLLQRKTRPTRIQCIH